jgi:homoserine kinase
MYLANYLSGNPFSEQQLLAWALALEGHADNIVPAVAGGLTTAMVLDHQVYYQKVALHDDIRVIIAVPDFIVPTREARAVLPREVPWRDCVRHLQQACFVVQSLANGDYRHLSLAMDDDIVQSSRQRLIPGLKEVIQIALERGALGAALSGAGPSVLALAAENMEYIGAGMQEAFRAAGCPSRCLYLNIDYQGIQIIDHI